MAENTDDLKEIFGADAAGLPQKDWEKRLKENEKTATSSGSGPDCAGTGK